MQMFAHYALPATIVASAFGAVVLCGVLFLYGFASEADVDARSPARRLFVIRLGHALAGASFAAALTFGTVALLDQRRVVASVPPATVPVAEVYRLEAEITRLAQRLAATEQRLATNELQLGDIVQQRAVADLPPRHESRPPATAAPSRLHRSTTTTSARRLPSAPTTVTDESMAAPRDRSEAIPGAPSQPTASPMSGRARDSENFGARMRADWQDVKRGFREAGEELRAGFSDFGRRVKQTFSREAN